MSPVTDSDRWTLSACSTHHVTVCNDARVNGSWLDPRVVSGLRNAGLDRHQVAFLQSCLLAGSPSHLFVLSGLAGTTAALSVPWAVTIATEHRRSGQPYASKTLDTARWAFDACESLVSAAGSHSLSVVSEWRDGMGALLATNGLTTAELPRIEAEVLRDHYRECLRVGLKRAGESQSPDEAALGRLAAEVGVGLLAGGRDVRTLSLRLRDVTPDNVDGLADLVVATPRRYSVMVGVQGVRDLSGIETHAPEIELSQLPREAWRRRFPGWSFAGHSASRVAKQLSEIQIMLPGRGGTNLGADTLLTCELLAVDHKSAASLARRRVAESLDQFVAGHPTARIRLMDLIVVSGEGDHFLSVEDTRPPTAKRLQPLPSNVPNGFRLGMRSAMLVRSAESPLNRAAMAWVALESAGIGNGNSKAWAAKVLSLHLLRQKIFAPYRMLATDSSSAREAARFLRYASTARNRSRRYSRPAPVGAPQSYKNARARGVELARVMESFYLLVARKFDDVEQERVRLLDALDLEENSTNPGSGFLRGISSWLESLGALGVPGEDVDLRLDQLVGASSPVVEMQVTALSRVVQSPNVAMEALESSRTWAAGILDLLYAARNVHLHAGLYSSEGDLALDQLGLLVPDAFFEIWAAWFGDASSSAMTCVDILKQLGERWDLVSARLAAGDGIELLDVGNLTGPAWVPDNRDSGARD